MNESAIRALVDDLVGAWNARDFDRFLGHLDESVVWDDPIMLEGPAIGRDAVRKFSEGLLRAFPDFSYRIRGPICVADSGNRCVIPWDITATHTGRIDPLGLAPTNQLIRMQGVDLLELTGTKVARIETLFNVLPALEQAIRLKPFAKRGFSKILMLWLQRSRAFWLRCTTKHKN